MCIVCNAGDAGIEFLDQFAKAAYHMRLAREAMLQVKDAVTDKDQKKKYDQAHKLMVRISHDWNSVEHQREVSHDESDSSPISSTTG